MTGAGSASLAFAAETSFLGSLAGAPDWYSFGRDARENEVSLTNQLQRMRDAGQEEAAESVAGNFEGAFGVSAVVSDDTHGAVESDIVFNASGAFESGAANSVTIAAGVDYLTGTAERELSGCIPLSYEIQLRNGQPVEYTLTMAYAEENTNTSLSPSGITEATAGSTVQFHSSDLSVSGATITKMQEATLSIRDIARFHFGWSRTPVDATAAQPTTELTTRAIYGGETYLEYALGSSGATSSEESVTAQSGTITLTTAGGTTVSTYTLPRLEANEYSWDDLVNAADLTEPVTWHVNGGVSV